MKSTLAAALFAAAFLSPVAVRAAAAQPSGAIVDLEKTVDAEAAKLGKVTPASVPFAQLAQRVTRKGALIRATFDFLTPVQSAGGGQTSFVGNHLAGGAFDFAFVTFRGDIGITTHSSAVVVGSFAGTHEFTRADGKKATMPVIAARLVGVVDGGNNVPGGLMSFPPSTVVRVYRLPADKPAAKKGTAPKPQL